MRTCIVISLFWFCSSAWAQDAPTHRAELIAWSADGTNALINEVITNPDGSGERAIRLLSNRGQKRVVVSQIANANTAKAQKISERTCSNRLKALHKTTTKRGFTDLDLDLTCADRARLIRVGGALSAKTADTWFSGEGLTLDRGALTLKLEDNTLVLTASGSPVATWPNTPQPLQMKAAMAAKGHLIIIFFGWEGNWRVIGALGSKDGDPKTLRKLRI